MTTLSVHKGAWMLFDIAHSNQPTRIPIQDQTCFRKRNSPDGQGWRVPQGDGGPKPPTSAVCMDGCCLCDMYDIGTGIGSCLVVFSLFSREKKKKKHKSRASIVLSAVLVRSFSILSRTTVSTAQSLHDSPALLLLSFASTTLQLLLQLD